MNPLALLVGAGAVLAVAAASGGASATPTRGSAKLRDVSLEPLPPLPPAVNSIRAAGKRQTARLMWGDSEVRREFAKLVHDLYSDYFDADLPRWAQAVTLPLRDEFGNEAVDAAIANLAVYPDQPEFRWNPGDIASRWDSITSASRTSTFGGPVQFETAAVEGARLEAVDWARALWRALREESS